MATKKAVVKKKAAKKAPAKKAPKQVGPIQTQGPGTTITVIRGKQTASASSGQLGGSGAMLPIPSVNDRRIKVVEDGPGNITVTIDF